MSHMLCIRSRIIFLVNLPIDSVLQDLGLHCFTTWERWHSDVNKYDEQVFWMMPRH